jgi:hypothetical protein
MLQTQQMTTAFFCSSTYEDLDASLSHIPETCWGAIIDSGASRHFCSDQKRFTNLESINKSVTTADGHTFQALGVGDIHIDLPNGQTKTTVTLKNTLYAPNIHFTLISLSCIVKGPTLMDHGAKLSHKNHNKQSSQQYLSQVASTKLHPITIVENMQMLPKQRWLLTISIVVWDTYHQKLLSTWWKMDSWMGLILTQNIHIQHAYPAPKQNSPKPMYPKHAQVTAKPMKLVIASILTSGVQPKSKL